MWREIYIEATPYFSMVMEVLDLADLQRRGLLKRASVETATPSPDILDFTVPRAVSSTSVAVASPITDTSSPLDFLSSFAQASAAPVVETTPASQSEQRSSDLSLKMDGVVNKLEDVLYKLETLTSRIAQLEFGLRNRDV